MYIIVRHSDNLIIGSATRPVDERHAAENGYKVFEIPDDEFRVEMVGSTLESFEEAE